MAGAVMYTASVLIAADLAAGRLNNGKLRLFVSAHTISPADGIGNYTAIEATFAGYPAGGVTVADWGTAYLNGANQGEVDAGLHSFTPTGLGLPTTVYGVFYTDSAGNLLWAEPDPFGGTVLSVAGIAYVWQPRWVDYSA